MELELESSVSLDGIVGIVLYVTCSLKKITSAANLQVRQEKDDCDSLAKEM